MKRKILAVLLVLALCFSAVPSAMAFDTGHVTQTNTMATGDLHTAVIDSTGTLWTWGLNGYGQLGDGTTENSSTPVKVMENVLSVSAGSFHTAAIKEDHTLWVWGFNETFALGTGDTTTSSTPQKIMDDVIAVSCSNYATAAIKSDGSLWMWGMNLAGELGNGGGGDKTGKNGISYQSTPAKIMDNVAAVSCGHCTTAAIKTDGTLWMWGNNELGQIGNGEATSYFTVDENGGISFGFGEDVLAPIKIMDNVSAVSVGYGNTAAIKTDGSLWMWGSNDYGQLGNGSEANAYVMADDAFAGIFHDILIQTTPVKIMDNVIDVNTGARNTAAVKADGSLWTWGENEYGQLGSGTTTASDVPIEVMKDVVRANITGGYFAAAVKTDGSVWTWGENNYGQLGDGTTTASSTPKKISGLTAKLSGETGNSPAPEQPAGSSAFTDVAASDYYYTPIQWAVAQGIANGTGNNRFSPEETCTKAQILTFLWRTMGRPEPTIESPFSDTVEDAYYNAALWAYEKGMVTGSVFEADSPCTRSMTVTYLWQASDSPDTEPSTKFRDVPASADYAQAVAWAVENGITTGDGEETFAPDDVCTRGQIVTFLYRTFGVETAAQNAESSAASSERTVSSTPLVPVQALANLDSIRRKMTDEQLAEAYAAAAKIVEKYKELTPEEQMNGIFKELRRISEEEIDYSMSEEHYDDPYGFFVLHTASCAGATRAAGLCLNMLGISYEHVNENQWTHQWCRAEIDGTYWICDVFGGYMGQEYSPYRHPAFPELA